MTVPWWAENACDSLEQCTLAGSVEAENTEAFALFNLEIDIGQRPEIVILELAGDELYEIFF